MNQSELEKLYRFTSLNMYLECPLRYKLNYGRGGTRELPNQGMLDGTERHEKAEKALLIGEWEYFPEKTRLWLRRHFAGPEGTVRPEQIERVFTLPGPDGVTPLIRGTVDLHNVKAEARMAMGVDWKSGQVPDSEMQLKTYATMIAYDALGKGIDIDYILMYFISFSTGQWVCEEYELPELRQHWKYLNEIISDIETEEELYNSFGDRAFKPRTGYHCRRCAKATVCPAAQISDVGALQIKNEEEAKYFVDKIVAIESHLKLLRGALGDWMLDNGKGAVISNGSRQYWKTSAYLGTGKEKRGKAKADDDEND